MHTLRVLDLHRVPGPQSEVEVLDLDPVADPNEDVFSRCTQAKVLRRASLQEIEQSHRPALPLRPGKILGIGRNFAAHAKELNHEVPSSPMLFFMPSTALLLDKAVLALPQDIGRIDMEAELVVMIGRPGKQISREDAEQHIGGLLLGNDVSARALQKSQPRWVRAKGADGFAPISRWIRVAPGLAPSDLRVQGWLNGSCVQDAPISQLVFGIPELIANISQTMTLECGDLIFTGTPSGVSPLEPGAICEVRAQGLCLAQVSTPIVAASTT